MPHHQKWTRLRSTGLPFLDWIINSRRAKDKILGVMYRPGNPTIYGAWWSRKAEKNGSASPGIDLMSGGAIGGAGRPMVAKFH